MDVTETNRLAAGPQADAESPIPAESPAPAGQETAGEGTEAGDPEPADALTAGGSPPVGEQSADAALDEGPQLLPLWKSHKVVSGFKITDVEPATLDGVAGAILHGQTPDGDRVGVFVSDEYIEKRLPLGQLGNAIAGYYVEYGDGHQSWSPAAAFENGYRPLVDVQKIAGGTLLGYIAASPRGGDRSGPFPGRMQAFPIQVGQSSGIAAQELAKVLTEQNSSGEWSGWAVVMSPDRIVMHEVDINHLI